MQEHEFDAALVSAAFGLAADIGWSRVTVTAAARRADLPLDRARRRFPGKGAILLRLGSLADQAALSRVSADGSGRDRMFDMIMRRIDVLQANRAGVLALLRYLPSDPLASAFLTAATLASMDWLLDAIDVPNQGAIRRIRGQGMLAVWLYTVRAWQRDTSEDLSATMAALDTALSRAEQADRWLGGRRDEEVAPEVMEPAPVPTMPDEPFPESSPPPPDDPGSPPV